MILKVTAQSDAADLKRTLSELIEVAFELGEKGLEFALMARDIVNEPGAIKFHASPISGACDVRVRISCPKLEGILDDAIRARDVERDRLRQLGHDGASHE